MIRSNPLVRPCASSRCPCAVRLSNNPPLYSTHYQQFAEAERVLFRYNDNELNNEKLMYNKKKQRNKTNQEFYMPVSRWIRSSPVASSLASSRCRCVIRLPNNPPLARCSHAGGRMQCGGCFEYSNTNAAYRRNTLDTRALFAFSYFSRGLRERPAYLRFVEIHQ